jgi:hypothetical protein
VTYFSEQSIEPFDFLKAENSFPSLIHWYQLTEQFHISLGWTEGRAYGTILSSHFICNSIFSLEVGQCSVFNFEFKNHWSVTSSAYCFLSESSFPHVMGLCNIFA